MASLRILQLLTYSFGIYAFGSLLVYWYRSERHGVLGTARYGTQDASPASRYARRTGGAMVVLCCLWFVFALLVTLVALDARWNADWLNVVHAVLLFQFPPMIVQVNYADELPVPRSGPWRAALAGLWIVSEAMVAYVLLASFGLLPTGQQVNVFVGLTISGLFVLAAIFSAAALMVGRRQRETPRQRSGRAWMLGLYALMLGLVILIVGAYVFGLALARVLSFVGSSMPLLFIFTAIYHENRFEFFDLFVKRGALVLTTIIVLTGFFGLGLPWLESFDPGWARPWVYAIVLLPVVLALTSLNRRMGQWLDNAWFGRRLTPVEAIKRFVSAVGWASDRQSAMDRAERALSEVFQAPVRIRPNLTGAPAPEFECALDVPVVLEGRPAGAILFGRRSNLVPYFSEDIALAGTLADVFSHTLETVELHENKQQQEQLARELTLQASRSELKALRAQVNPHFLFNALNAIAGLIHKDPMRADRTVEQLADVFRYTLRGSQSEWASLEDEMDFARSYLEVEQARFGAKLDAQVRTPVEAAGLGIPTMMIQTLVENAVKHGVARMRGASRVEVAARVVEDRLLVEVADSGPGFVDEHGDPTPSKTDRRSRRGFGLRNVRERLAGHFGEAARLEIRRDAEHGMTVVSLSLPLAALRKAGAEGQSGPREGTGAA